MRDPSTGSRSLRAESRGDWHGELRTRLASLGLTPTREAAIVEELSLHLDDQRRDLIASGVDPETATERVLAGLPPGERLASAISALRLAHATAPPDMPTSNHPLAGWRADLRDAWRAIRRTPLQAVTMIVSLAIGSTLTVLMFGVVNAMVTGATPGVRDHARLVRLGVQVPRFRGPRSLTMEEFRLLPASVGGLQGVGGELSWRFSTSINGQAVSLQGRFVSGSYFPVLGTDAVAGRVILPSDDAAGAAPVVVIGHQLWQRSFGGDPKAIGSTIQVGPGTYEVIGVLPPRFVGIDTGDFGEISDDRGQIWLPMREMWTYPDYGAAFARGPRSGIGYVVGPRMIGRLAVGLSRRKAEAQAQDILPALAAAGHEATTVRLTPFTLLPSSDPYRKTMFIGVLMSVPFIVLGIACANVAGIQVARAAGRTHEISIRMSLGASRYRVARLIAIETAVMAFIAGGLGWLVATQALRFAGSVLPFPVTPDGRVLMFATVLPLLTSLIAGFAPAWGATGINVLSGLRLAPRAGAPGRSRLRRAVVVGQVALSVLLLVVATTLGRSIVSLDTTIGPLHEDVFATAMRFGDLAFDATQARDVRTSLTNSVAALPGVASVAVSGSPEPFRGFTGLCWANPAADDDVANRSPSLSVTPTFFSTIGLSLRRGRVFDAGDHDGVVIVNDAFAARLAAGTTEVLGSMVRLSGPAASAPQLAQIIGVVSDGYERLPRGVASPRCYVPLDPSSTGGFSLFVRSTVASTLAPQVQRILGRMDSRLAPREIGTVAGLIRARYQPLYWITQALAAVSLIALVLSAVGLFALMSYSVSQRTSEFGIRIALGAHPGRIALGVLRNALALTAVGTLIGIAASIPITLILSEGVLRTISWRDPGPSLTVAAALLAVAALATLSPTSRAWRVDPVEALRAD